MAAQVHKKATADVIDGQRRPASVVPAPPATLSRDEKRYWREFWRTAIAATWTNSDEHIVSILCRLYVQAEVECTAGIAGQIANISSTLGLTVKSRAVLQVEMRKPEPTSLEGGRGRFTKVS